MTLELFDIFTFQLPYLLQTVTEAVKAIAGTLQSKAARVTATILAGHGPS